MILETEYKQSAFESEAEEEVKLIVCAGVKHHFAVCAMCGETNEWEDS